MINYLFVNYIQTKLAAGVTEVREAVCTHHLHTQGAVGDGLRLDVDVHERTRDATLITGAKRGRHKRLVTHGGR